MAHAVATRGYSRTSVAEVIKLAGVSRTTFYEHFDNKQDCFVAAHETMIYRMVKNIRSAYQTGGNWDTALTAVFGALARDVVADPFATRIVILGAADAGPGPLRLAQRARAVCERILRESLTHSPRGSDISPVLTRGILGGVQGVICRRLLDDRVTELPMICRELLDWTLSYHVATVLRDTDGEWADAVRFSDGGPEETQREEIQAARQTHEAVCAYRPVGGSPRRSWDRRQSSPATFARGTRAGSVITELQWVRAIHESLRALLVEVNSNPDLGRLGFTEIANVTNASARRVSELLNDFLALLRAGYEITLRPTRQVVPEAIARAVWENIRHETLGGPMRSPADFTDELADLALTPFIGPVELAAITGGQPRGYPKPLAC